jgi:2-methylcitrate dehydratase PrpD
MVLEQGFKAHGSCWWSQPAIEAVLTLARGHGFGAEDVVAIRVATFERATHLDHPAPETTEQAQYSLPFPVAAALVKATRLRDTARHRDAAWYGLGPDDLLEDALGDPGIRRLAAAVELVEAPDLSAVFPQRFLARVTLTLADGRVLTSPDTTFRGELDDPFTDDELTTKARWLARGLLSDARAERLIEAAWSMADTPSIEPFLRLIAATPDRS